MRHKGECNEHIIPYIAKCSRPIIFANFANEAIRENFCREFHMHIIPIDPVTMVTGVLSDVSKTRKLLYFARDLNHLDTGCLNPVDPCS